MNILTYFDQGKILDGWRGHIERKFSHLPNARFIHANAFEDAVTHIRSNDADMVLFSFSDGRDGAWTKLLPHFRKGQIPVLITGDLDKGFYTKRFREQTGQTLEVLDAVSFYDQAEALIKRIGERFICATGECKE